MKILVYCQHVLGIGHLCRILAILRALDDHRITLVLGGPPVDLEFPDHVRVVQLPPLRMDADFQNLQPVDPAGSLDQVRTARRRQLLELFRGLQPDVLLIELFPFGRYAFRFELDPLLEEARTANRAIPVVCSVRDILVERDNAERFENRVVSRLNRNFDLLMIHGDPAVLTLDETFSGLDRIHIPIVYTGYICETAAPGSREELRGRLEIAPGEVLIVCSAGSGSVGHGLLEAVVRAARLLPRVRMQVFTGPYLDRQHVDRLRRLAPPSCRIDRFADDFPVWLAAADLSVSMGGYNTTMNVVAAGCPALIYPFAQNREQRLRAERLQGRTAIRLLDAKDLDPERLALLMSDTMTGKRQESDVALDGAAAAARQLCRLQEARP